MRNGPRIYLLLGAWAFGGLYTTGYAWLTASAYARIVFASQEAERGIALRECSAVPDCAPDAADHLLRQESMLDNIMLVVRGTAWLMVLLQVLLLAVVTVLVLRRRGAAAPAGARLAGVAWKIQTALIGLLLLVYLGMLGRGQATLAGIPDPARMVTFETAFESPFFDVGTMYYLAWFVVMNAGVILSSWGLSRILRAPAPAGANRTGPAARA